MSLLLQKKSANHSSYGYCHYSVATGVVLVVGGAQVMIELHYLLDLQLLRVQQKVKVNKMPKYLLQITYYHLSLSS